MDHALLSALGASDQPYFYIFIGTDVLAAVFLLLMLWKSGKLYAWLLRAFAVFNILAATFPQSQAHPDFSSGINFFHAIFSSLAVAILVLAVLLSIWRIKKALFIGLSIVDLIGLALSSISASFPQALGPWTQELSAILIGLWLIVLALYLSGALQVGSKQAVSG